MLRIMFVCYGNICRSPMAEFMMKEFLFERGEGDGFYISSAATSDEEVGHPVHRGARAVLDRLGISYAGKVAVRLKKSDYGNYDYFLGMDGSNVRDMKEIFGGDPEGKVSLLSAFTDGKDIADPWFTGDFERASREIMRGIAAFCDYIKGKKSN